MTRRSTCRRGEQIEDAERRLFELAETGRYDGGFESFSDAVKTAIDMASAAYHARRPPLRHRHRAAATSTPAWAACSVRLDRARRPPRHGQDVARHQHRLQHRRTPMSRPSRPTARSRRRMAASSASSRSKCRPSSSPPVSFPSRPKFRPRRSAAATSPKPISKSWSPARRRCRRSRCSSTRPAASRSPSLPPARAA